jgi:hypothetical protein
MCWCECVVGWGMSPRRCARRAIRRRCAFSSFVDPWFAVAAVIGTETDDASFLVEAGKIFPLLVNWMCTGVRDDLSVGPRLRAARMGSSGLAGSADVNGG